MSNSITPSELVNNGHVIAYMLNTISRTLSHLLGKNKEIELKHTPNTSDKSLTYVFTFN